MPSEAQARIAINKLLEEASWRFLPDAKGRRENIVCEHRVTKKVFAPNVDLGADSAAPHGRWHAPILARALPRRERLLPDETTG